MIEIQNKDSSFFVIESPDFATTRRNEIFQREFERGSSISKITKKIGDISKFISDKVVSFSITEDLGQLTRGTLQLYDSNHIFSRVFREGMRFNITWGYKKWNKRPKELSVTSNNPNEIHGSGERKGLKCFIETPSGLGNIKGGILYNVSFWTEEFLADRVLKSHESGSRKEVINFVFANMGISAENRIIDFDDQDRRVTTISPIRQDESDYKFLFNLSVKFRTFFQVGYNQQGEKIGQFVSAAKLGSSKFVEKVTNGKGFHRTLTYLKEKGNVIDYRWQNHVGENGSGDGVTLTVVNGKTVTSRRVVKTESVTTWRLVPERINKALKEAAAEKKLAQETIKLLSGGFAQKDFKQIEHFFVQIKNSTAPQGFGYSLNVNMIGDSLVTATQEVILGAGFPDRVRQTDRTEAERRDPIFKLLTRFYIKKAVHNISNTGYTMALEVGDAFSVFGGAVA